MPPTPDTLPQPVRARFSHHAVAGVLEADAIYPRPDADTRRRTARLRTLGALHTDLTAGDGIGLDPIGRTKLRQGIGILIDAAEDVTHGVAGELTDAGIAAAARKAKCQCGPTFLRILRGFVDLAVEAAFTGLRSAIRL